MSTLCGRRAIVARSLRSPLSVRNRQFPTNCGKLNRQTQELERDVTYRKQRVALSSNRQKIPFCKTKKFAATDAKHLSNRELRLLKSPLTHRKQKIAPRSNRELSTNPCCLNSRSDELRQGMAFYPELRRAAVPDRCKHSGVLTPEVRCSPFLTGLPRAFFAKGSVCTHPFPTGLPRAFFAKGSVCTRPFLTGSAPQTEFDVTRSKQTPGKFLTGARMHIKDFEVCTRRPQKFTRCDELARVNGPTRRGVGGSTQIDEKDSRRLDFWKSSSRILQDWQIQRWRRLCEPLPKFSRAGVPPSWKQFPPASPKHEKIFQSSYGCQRQPCVVLRLRENISMSLSRWGWNSYFEAMWSESDRENAVPARVVAQHRKCWRIAGEFGECLAEASGKLRLTAEAGADWPAVGDWVSAEVNAACDSALVRAVLPRRNQFTRKAPGKRIEEQVIAANVETALVISALDGDANPRRAERYIAQCWELGVRPVLILNKADACEDAGEKAAAMESVALDVPVHIVSAITGEGMEEVERLLIPGQTLVMLGSSGVGKSTLTNRLLGQSVQKVNEVRANDGRGRHTTTTRELFALPCGALLIDTPGLRELQLWNGEEGLAQTFADIHSLAERCRFTNCRHEKEPGCAVQAAVQAGALDLARLENQRKLIREQEFLRRKMDPEARSDEKQRIKRLMREVRKIYAHKNDRSAPG